MKLTKYEKKTIILTSERDATTSIYTYNADLKRRLEKFNKQPPPFASWKAAMPRAACPMYRISPECL